MSVRMNSSFFVLHSSFILVLHSFSFFINIVMRNLINFLIKYNYCLLFLLLEIVSFTLLFRFNSYQGSVFFTSANYVSGVIYECGTTVTGYFGLRSINKALVQRNVALELEVDRLIKEKNRASIDTSLVGNSSFFSVPILSGYRIYPAEVINNSIVRTDNYITLDRGTDDGILPEMGVVSGSGIVGIVYKASAHYSVVLSVLNSRSNISCKIKRTDYFGSLRWEGGSSQYAYLKDMPRHSEFSLGDTVVTSGHSAVFPEGIPIGVVDDMSDSNDGLSYKLKVKLFTDFARLGEVRVIASDGLEERIRLENSVLPQKNH